MENRLGLAHLNKDLVKSALPKIPSSDESVLAEELLGLVRPVEVSLQHGRSLGQDLPDLVRSLEFASHGIDDLHLDPGSDSSQAGRAEAPGDGSNFGHAVETQDGLKQLLSPYVSFYRYVTCIVKIGISSVQRLD